MTINRRVPRLKLPCYSAFGKTVPAPRSCLLPSPIRQPREPVVLPPNPAPPRDPNPARAPTPGGLKPHRQLASPNSSRRRAKRRHSSATMPPAAALCIAGIGRSGKDEQNNREDDRAFPYHRRSLLIRPCSENRPAVAVGLWESLDRSGPLACQTGPSRRARAIFSK